MLPLQKINLYSMIIDTTYDSSDMDMQALFDAAVIGLVRMGVLDVGVNVNDEEFIMIDDEEYILPLRTSNKLSDINLDEISSVINTLPSPETSALSKPSTQFGNKADKNLPKKTLAFSENMSYNKAEVVSGEENPPQKREKAKAKTDDEIIMEEDMDSPVMDDVPAPAPAPVPVAPAPAMDGGNANGEKLSVIDIHQITLTNKEDPSDMAIIKFTVVPLSFNDNESLTDIAVVADTGDKQVAAVSKVNSGQRSIRLKLADKYKFSLRGDFEAGEYKTVIYSCDETREDYDMEDKVTQHFPSTIDPSVYREAFAKDVNGAVIYCFPLMRANEPNGIAKTVIILETDSKRMVAKDENGIATVFYNNKNYRVYGKWEGNHFAVTVDAV